MYLEDYKSECFEVGYQTLKNRCVYCGIGNSRFMAKHLFSSPRLVGFISGIVVFFLDNFAVFSGVLGGDKGCSPKGNISITIVTITNLS
jgi:hypothetical protein